MFEKAEKEIDIITEFENKYNKDKVEERYKKKFIICGEEFFLTIEYRDWPTIKWRVLIYKGSIDDVRKEIEFKTFEDAQRYYNLLFKNHEDKFIVGGI